MNWAMAVKTGWGEANVRRFIKLTSWCVTNGSRRCVKQYHLLAILTFTPLASDSKDPAMMALVWNQSQVLESDFKAPLLAAGQWNHRKTVQNARAGLDELINWPFSNQETRFIWPLSLNWHKLLSTQGAVFCRIYSAVFLAVANDDNPRNCLPKQKVDPSHLFGNLNILRNFTLSWATCMF